MSPMDDKLRPPTALLGELLPWFIYTHGDAKSKKVQTFSTSPFNNKSYLKSVPEMRGKFIQAAHLGWLLLRDKRIEDHDNYSFTLWNPFTLKSIQLPTLNFDDVGPLRMRFALTSSPCDNDDDDINNNCFAFLFFRGWAFCCQLDLKKRRGCSSWVSERFEVEGESAAMLSVVTLNGVLYGCAVTLPTINRSRKHWLVCIKVADDGSKSFTIKQPFPLITMPETQFMLYGCNTLMVESCGSIYVVKIGTRHYEGVFGVVIFELDLQNGTLVEVKCLGDRAFLIVQDGCTWWPASTGTVKGNCVYLYHGEFVRDAVVCYSLNDSSSTFLPCPKLLNPRCLSPVWVTPRPRQHNNNRFVSIDKIVIKSCQVEVEAEKKQENNMYKLPLHLIELTSKYMHLFDYWSFRCTSKIIQSATPMPQWKKNNMLPLLMVFEDEGGLCRIMDPCRDDSRFCNLQAQDFFDIRFSKNGWLIIHDGKYIQFFNPFTREKRYIPHPTLRFLTIGFSSYPSCSSCLTVVINDVSGGIIINYMGLEDKEWKSCRYANNQGDTFYPGVASPMYFAGRFYFLDKDTGKLGVFQLEDGEPRWTVYGRPFVRAGELHSSYLVECGGDIISVFIGKNASWVQVFKFNYLNKKWFRVKDIGNHILFISHTSCFSEVAKVRRMRNRIYLPWIIGNKIVYYSLDTQKYHVDGSQDEYKDFFFFKQPFRCCWI